MQPIQNIDKREKISRWWKGTIIKEFDIYSFLLMYTFREIGTIHIKNIFDPNNESKLATITSRLNRQGERMFCKGRVINRNRPTFRLTMFSLKEKGFEVLTKDLSLLDDKSFEQSQLGNVSLHRLTMLDAVSKMLGVSYESTGNVFNGEDQQMVNGDLSPYWFLFDGWEVAALETEEEGERIFPVHARRVEQSKKDIYIDVQCINPYFHPYLRKVNENQKESLINPDWVLRLNERVINIEIDMGTEGLQTLFRKLDGYSLMVNEAPYKKFKHSIYIVCADETARAVNVSPKVKRIKNIKRILSEHRAFKEKEFEIFVLPLRRSAQVFKEQNYNLSGLRDKTNKVELLEEIFDLMTYGSNVASTIEVKFEEREKIEEEIKKGDYELLIKKTSKKGESSFIAMLYMQEGSVRDFERLRKLNELTRDSLFDVNIFAIYYKHEAIRYDFMDAHLDLHERVFFTSVEDLSNIEGDYKIYNKDMKGVAFD